MPDVGVKQALKVYSPPGPVQAWVVLSLSFVPQMAVFRVAAPQDIDATEVEWKKGRSKECRVCALRLDGAVLAAYAVRKAEVARSWGTRGDSRTIQ